MASGRGFQGLRDYLDCPCAGLEGAIMGCYGKLEDVLFLVWQSSVKLSERPLLFCLLSVVADEVTTIRFLKLENRGHAGGLGV